MSAHVGVNLGSLVTTLGNVLEMEGDLLKPLTYVKETFDRVDRIVIERQACMFMSSVKVDQAKDMSRLPSGYTLACLGYHPDSTPIMEYAHRLVLYSIYGPPPLPDGWRTKGPHVLHMCGHKDCINVSHLVFGSATDNKEDTNDVYVSRLVEQGRR
jgi:hypothetical protein